MSAVDGRGSTSKAPAAGLDHDSAAGLGVGFQTQAKMTSVQPPKKEDLQRSYATLGDDANPKGWYGSMSTSRPPPERTAPRPG